jgi:tRNA(Ile)-lysidine synthase
MKPLRKKVPDWPAVAAALAGRISHGALHPGAMETAWAAYQQAKRRKSPSPRWAVAFSGGADSLALLLILWAEGAGRWGRGFTVLHFNHRLRGRTADADERFCAGVCAALGLTFVAGRWDKPPGKASEAEARAARLAFFHREMGRRRIRFLWLAHQQDDIAETMLMRLARGSGTAGLAAPRPAQPMPGNRWHLRPLLTLKKAEIVAALRAAGAAWREDATNAGDDFLRNRIRSRVLPAWIRATAGRDALAGAALARGRLEEDDHALEIWLAAVSPLRPDGTLDLKRLAGFPRALWRRALHHWLLAQKPVPELSRAGFESLLAACEAGRTTRQSLGHRRLAEVRGGRLAARMTSRRAGKYPA